MLSLAKPRLLTSDEFQKMGELGVFRAEDRLELHDGVIVEMAAQNNPYILRMGRINELFTDLFRAISFVSIQCDMRIDDYSYFMPDVVLFKPQTDEYFLEVGFRAEDALLVLEVSDTSRSTDLGYKASEYGIAGIPDYWVADLNGHRLIVHRDPWSEGYRTITVHQPGEAVAPLAFPDLAVPVEPLIGAAQPG